MAHGEAQSAAQAHFQTLIQSFYGVQISSLAFYGALYFFAEQRAIAAGRPSLWKLYAPMRWTGLIKFVGAGVGGAAALVVGIVLWSKITASPLTPAPSEAALMPGSQSAYKYLRIALSMLTVGLIGPCIEELFFRGLLQRWLTQRLPSLTAILLGALIFALFHFKMLLHLNSWGVLLTLGIGSLGVATGLLFRKFGSLWPGFVLHASYNLALIGVSLLGHT
jgi:membrane protease YdiL (CAAX protease family)